MDSKFAIVSVIVFQFLNVCDAFHLQRDDGLNVRNISVKTLTITDDFNGNFRVSETYPNSGTDFDTDQSSLDTWSVIWYIASFGGLILFFLIVSCSEWCCRRNARRNCQRNSPPTVPPVIPDTPPPSYDLFAPPSYEDLWKVGNSRGEKSEYDIYVVPVHALGTIMAGGAHPEDAPPSYQTASAGFAHPSDLARVHSSSASSRVT